jgi:hypothetical protein
MTPKEQALMARIVSLRARYEACNPEVGMGPFPQTIVSEELDHVQLLATPQEFSELVSLAREGLR